MFEFKNASASKALRHGTNMSCLDSRFYVCRVKKDFVINNDQNTILLEAGDIIICNNCYDKDYGKNKVYGIAVRTTDSMLNMTAKDMMNHDIPLRLGHIPMMPIDDFKESFDIIDDKTESLTKCFRFACGKKDDEKFKAAKEKCNSICDMYRKKEHGKNIKLQIIMGLAGILITIGLIVLAVTCVSANENDPTALQILTLVGIVMGAFLFGACGIIILWMTSTGDTLDLIEIKDRPLQDEANKEIDALLQNFYLEIDNFRREHGWLSNTTA
jgi:hypothetical protein